MSARSRLSRAPPNSSRAEIWEIAHPFRAMHQCIRVLALCHGRCQSEHRCRPGKACKQFRFAGETSTPEIAPKLVYVFDTIGDVSPILPHAVESEIPNRAAFCLEAVGTRRDLHLDDGSFVDSHVLEGQIPS